MEWFIKWFIRASLLWFSCGILLGVGMSVYPQWMIYRPAHAHMNVVGFLTMLVFGVGYQLLPRLFGHPLFSRKLGEVHLFLANAGLTGMVLGFFFRPHNDLAGRWSTAVGGVLYALGATIWVYNLWRTFDAADDRELARKQAGRSQLPTLGE